MTNTVDHGTRASTEMHYVRQVLDVLTTTGPSDARTIAFKTGRSARQARDALAQLARSGRAERLARGQYRASTARRSARPRPRVSSRNGWGVVRRKFEEALIRYPERVWHAQDLADEIGVNAAHAAVLLAEAARRGVLVRSAPGRYRLGSAQDAELLGVDRWRTVGLVEGQVLLRRADGTLWTAVPTTLSA